MKKMIKRSMMAAVAMAGLVSMGSAAGAFIPVKPGLVTEIPNIQDLLTTTAQEGISVPNSFSAGQTASAADVNENFSKLRDGINANTVRLSGLKYVEPSNLTLTTSAQNLTEITVNAPADGYIHLMSTGVIIVNNKDNTNSWIGYVWITDEVDGSGGFLFDVQLLIPQTDTGTFYERYSIQRAYPVSAGENTFYIRAYKANTTDSSSVLMENRVTATFHASEL